MAIQGLLAIIETVMYYVVGITGLVAAVTVGISRDAFSGQCILYSDIVWCNETYMGFTSLGRNEACSFAVWIQVIASLYALGFGIYYVLILIGKIEGLKFLTIPSIVINVCLTLILFVQSCIVSVGFKRFCDGLTANGHVPDCSKGSSTSWNNVKTCKQIDYQDHDHYSGDVYFGFFTTGQSASWFSVLFWLIIAILSIIRRIRDKPAIDPSSDKAGITSNAVI